jgi:hypothetical protein
MVAIDASFHQARIAPVSSPQLCPESIKKSKGPDNGPGLEQNRTP